MTTSRNILLLAVVAFLARACEVSAQAAEPALAPQPPPSAYTASWVANSFALHLGGEYWAHVLDRAPSDL